MLKHYWVAFFVVVSWAVSFTVLDASAGDADPRYGACLNECGETGCVGQRCFHIAIPLLMGSLLVVHGTCKNLFISSGNNGIAKVIAVTIVRLTERKKEKQKHLVTVQSNIMVNGPSSVFMGSRFAFFGLCALATFSFTLYFNGIVVLWLVLFDTLSFIWGPASVAFSVLNLATHFHGWISFFILIYYNLPLRRDRKTYYYFANLWHIYALLSLTSWFASAVFHSKKAFYSILTCAIHMQTHNFLFIIGTLIFPHA